MNKEELNKKIAELNNIIYKEMGSINQITIDYVQEAYSDFFNTDEYVSTEKIGAFCYQISVVLEVIDSKLTKDIYILNELYGLLNQLIKVLEVKHEFRRK